MHLPLTASTTQSKADYCLPSGIVLHNYFNHSEGQQLRWACSKTAIQWLDSYSRGLATIDLDLRCRNTCVTWLSFWLLIGIGELFRLTGVSDLPLLCLMCRDPLIGSLAISLGITSAAAVYDIHKTLQFLGVLAILGNVGTAPLRYSSVEASSHLQFQETLSRQ